MNKFQEELARRIAASPMISIYMIDPKILPTILENTPEFIKREMYEHYMFLERNMKLTPSDLEKFNILKDYYTYTPGEIEKNEIFDFNNINLN